MPLSWFRGLVREVRASIDVRRQAAVPRSARLAAVAVSLAALYIAAAIVLVPEGKVPEFHFADERGAITALSAVLLALGCAFALASFLIGSDDPGRQRVFWLAMTAGLGFLALDELLQFHEQLGYRLDRIDVLRDALERTPIRKWDDAVVLLYGLVALPLAILFLPTVLRFPRVLEYLGVAVFFYAVHTITDALVEPRTVLSVISEESAKLLCSTLLALATLVGLLANVERIRSSVRRVPVPPAARVLGGQPIAETIPHAAPAAVPGPSGSPVPTFD